MGYFTIFDLVCKVKNEPKESETTMKNDKAQEAQLQAAYLDPYEQYQKQIQTPRPDVIREFTTEEVDYLFTYHAPRNDFEKEAYREITRQFRELAHFISATLPNGPGKTVAIRALVDARMKANAAIALQGRF